MNDLILMDALRELRVAQVNVFEKIRLPYFIGCRLKVLVVADGFLYFNDENFGLSQLVSTLRGLSTSRYPVTVDLAHRSNPGAARLNGATPNYVFQFDQLKKYHQVWLFAAERSASGALPDAQRQALRRFMDEGGGVFATGDHEDLGVTVGGYLPRVRSMRDWFWPNPGPQGEPVAPHGSNATRHDTNRMGHDAGFSFNDQSDDVPQTIAPRYFGTGLVRAVHPLLCTPSGPIRVLPDHPHEGECRVPADLEAEYTIGADRFREYPDGPDGRPVAPVVVATSTMIPGAEAAGKPPVPGGSFGAIAAWDGHRAGDFGRVVVDATWHHFININLVGDRNLGAPNPAVPKTLGFLATAAGMAHYERIQDYFRNIAEWLTPRSQRRCLVHRQIWCLVNEGTFRESLRVDDPVFTGRLVLERLRLLGPCERLGFLDDLVVDLKPAMRALLDPFLPSTMVAKAGLEGLGEADGGALAEEVAATLAGTVALQFLDVELTPDALRQRAGDDEPEVKELAQAAQKGIRQGLARLGKQIERQMDARRALVAAL